MGGGLTFLVARVCVIGRDVRDFRKTELHTPEAWLHGSQKLLLGNLTYYLEKFLKIVELFV
jgi:hypothetical protein